MLFNRDLRVHDHPALTAASRGARPVVPNRTFNLLRQAARFDPDGAYVRRYVEELAGVPGRAVHQPWRLPPAEREALGYPDRLA
jgi:deoxyribodipyrimidine photolyase